MHSIFFVCCRLLLLLWFIGSVVPLLSSYSWYFFHWFSFVTRIFVLLYRIMTIKQWYTNFAFIWNMLDNEGKLSLFHILWRFVTLVLKYTLRVLRTEFVLHSDDFLKAILIEEDGYLCRNWMQRSGYSLV